MSQSAIYKYKSKEISRLVKPRSIEKSSYLDKCCIRQHFISFIVQGAYDVALLPASKWHGRQHLGSHWWLGASCGTGKQYGYGRADGVMGHEAIGKTKEKGKRKGSLEKKTCHGAAIMLHAHGSVLLDERGVGKGDQKWLGT